MVLLLVLRLSHLRLLISCSIGLATRYYFERVVTDGIRASGSRVFRICAGFLRSSVILLDIDPYYYGCCFTTGIFFYELYSLD